MKPMKLQEVENFTFNTQLKKKSVMSSDDAITLVITLLSIIREDFKTSVAIR